MPAATTSTNRRNMIKNLAAGSAALVAGSAMLSSFEPKEKEEAMKLKGNINHAVCPWPYNNLTLDELCEAIKGIGFAAIDLLGPKDWPTVQKHGVFSSMCNGAEISLYEGWCHPEYHSTLIKNYTDMIPLVAKAGYKNLICFSGARKGMDDETGMKNCADGLKNILGLAEKNGVVLQMELLNSKIDHKDYMCDKSAWGVALCKQLSSENFKLLFDIYHMQIDEGDIIRTIEDNHVYFGHYHTGGVPGRHEIDETQELYYPAIMRAIAKTGFKDYVSQEFVPTWPDKIAALKKCVEICDV